MSDSFKFKAFHICGIPSCKDRQPVLLSSYDDNIYVENLSNHQNILKIDGQEVTDIQFFEEEELKEKISVLKILAGYALFDIAGAVLCTLSGFKCVNHQYLYIQTKTDEFLFELKQ